MTNQEMNDRCLLPWSGGARFPLIPRNVEDKRGKGKSLENDKTYIILTISRRIDFVPGEIRQITRLSIAK